MQSQATLSAKRHRPVTLARKPPTAEGRPWPPSQDLIKLDAVTVTLSVKRGPDGKSHTGPIPSQLIKSTGDPVRMMWWVATPINNTPTHLWPFVPRSIVAKARPAGQTVTLSPRAPARQNRGPRSRTGVQVRDPAVSVTLSSSP